MVRMQRLEAHDPEVAQDDDGKPAILPPCAARLGTYALPLPQS